MVFWGMFSGSSRVVFFGEVVFLVMFLFTSAVEMIINTDAMVTAKYHNCCCM